MSLVNLILLSTTPIAGLGMLLGIDRFEKWALDENRSQRRAAGAVNVVAEVRAEFVPEMQTEPAHQVAA